MQISSNGTTLYLDEAALRYTIEAGGSLWQWQCFYEPYFICESDGSERTVRFLEAKKISHRTYTFGVGCGIISRFEDFIIDGVEKTYIFETFVWIETSTGHVYFEWIPLCEDGLHVKKVFWPGPMTFEEKRSDWYTLLTHQQGLLIPNDWPVPLEKPVFDGFFGTAGGYMPWFGQVRGRQGYIAICLTPWNAGYNAEDLGGIHVSVRFEESLGRMDERRVMRYTFLDDCDYNDLCKVYRAYVNECGRLRTLSEKAARNPSVDDLIGCAFVHTGIKTFVQPDSDFFDKENPQKNNHLTSFSKRAKEIYRLHTLGVKKLYLHLDGWAQPGYDNNHPDYLPACREAGGWDGMRELSDAVHECGYMFGIHDQYRDYYKRAESYDENFACMNADGTIPGHKHWAGGPQSYLCATQAPYYVRRNFSEIERQGIRLDGAYLDVFTCNEGDECANPMHKMSRRDCYEFRGRCFEWLLSKGILTSSEEVSDWAVPSLVFCHYAPYDFMMRAPGGKKQGIPVPLYNLVYHDCVIEPWMMEAHDGDDYMLYALLNGGAPYLIRDGAYPNTDGAFETKSSDSDNVDKKDGETAARQAAEAKLVSDIGRCRVVSELHERIAKCEMVRHEFVGGDVNVHKTVFSDGTAVIVDFTQQSYKILNGQRKN